MTATPALIGAVQGMAAAGLDTGLRITLVPVIVPPANGRYPDIV